ncbi:MAG: Ig-like domain-containing protein [Treponema sp.]|nr:Ig-like domain-containing protein [Treponema sp.]
MKKAFYGLCALAVLFAAAGCASSSGDDGDSTVALTDISLDTALSAIKTETGYMLSLNNEVSVSPDFTPENATNKGYTITVVSEGDEEAVSWDSSECVLKGAAIGSSTVTVTASYDETISKSYTISVAEVALTGLSLSAETCYLGRTASVTPAYTPANASYKTLTWSSSDENIATVDSSGTITGVAEGTVTITAVSAADDSVSAELELTVKPVLPTALSLKKSAFVVQAGGSCDIVPCFTPEDTTNQAVTFVSDNDNVTVSDSGVVSVSDSVTSGTKVSVTVKSVAVPSLTATATVTVTDGETFIIDDENSAYGFVSSTGSLSSNQNYSGFSGSSFFEGFSQGTGDSLVYSVYAAAEQDAAVLLHYAYWGSKTDLRGAYIVVNGAVDSDILYLNWTSKNGKNDNIKSYDTAGNALTYHQIWEDSNEITVHLDAGENQIRVIAVPSGTEMPDAVYPSGVDTTATTCTYTASGYLSNIDYIQIRGSGLGAGSNSLAFYSVAASGDFGSATVTPVQDFYKEGASVTLSATANSGYQFDVWHGRTASGDFVASTEENYTFTISDDVTVSAHCIPSGYTPDSALTGYAGITADRSDAAYTISGGAGGETLTISSLSDLTAAASKLSGDTPYIVKFTSSSRICTSNNKSIICSIGSNKTLYGVVTGAGLKNIELRVSGQNVIIRNLILGEVIAYDTLSDYAGSGNDALSLNGARHVWVDHCELRSNTTPLDINGKTVTNSSDSDFAKDWYDGLLDIKNGATWITVSNCYFHDHYKACLCGSSDEGPGVNSEGYSDSDMRVTFANNYWYNINARQPLFRYGKAHIYGSYFDAGSFSGSASFINCRAGSELYIEGNTFTGTKSDSYTIGFYYADSSKAYGTTSGTWVSVNNSGVSSKTGTSYRPAYGVSGSTAPSAKPDGVGATIASSL